jgi:Ras-related protein Rab-5C
MDSFSLKLVIAGNTGVGKTCIVKRATLGTFHDETTPTLGASYVSKHLEIGKSEFRLQIWDTAGQERYRGMTPMYFRGAQAALIVYSITDLRSFDAVDFWINSLHEHGEADVIIFVVANKSDLEDERRISSEEGEGKAATRGALFFEVSAQTGDGIEDLFVNVCKMALEKSTLKPVETKDGGEQRQNEESGCC